VNRHSGFAIPPFLIQPLIWTGVIAIGLAVLAWSKHRYDEKLREEGRHELEVKAAKETFRQQEAWTRRAQDSEAGAAKVEEKHRERFTPIFKGANDAERAAPITRPVGASVPNADFERLFNDARDSAEASRSAAVPGQAAPAPASSTEALVIQLYDWAGKAIERDEQWRNFYESLKKDQQIQQQRKDGNGNATSIFSVAP
jgi:hypothetical protein